MPERSSISVSSEKECDELLTLALDQIVLQKDMESVLAQLERSVDADTAEQIYREAMFDYLALKESGKLSDYEYDLNFNRAKNPATPTERFGLIFMGVGFLGLIMAIGAGIFLEPNYSKFLGLLVLTAPLIPTGFLMFIFGREADKSESGKLLLRFMGGKSLFSLGDVVKRLRRGRL